MLTWPPVLAGGQVVALAARPAYSAGRALIVGVIVRWGLFWFIVIGIMLIAASLVFVMYLLMLVPRSWQDVISYAE